MPYLVALRKRKLVIIDHGHISRHERTGSIHASQTRVLAGAVYLLLVTLAADHDARWAVAGNNVRLPLSIAIKLVEGSLKHDILRWLVRTEVRGHKGTYGCECLAHHSDTLQVRAQNVVLASWHDPKSDLNPHHLTRTNKASRLLLVKLITTSPAILLNTGVVLHGLRHTLWRAQPSKT